MKPEVNWKLLLLQKFDPATELRNQALIAEKSRALLASAAATIPMDTPAGDPLMATFQ